MNPDFIRLEVIKLLVSSGYYNDAEVPDSLRVQDLLLDSSKISEFMLTGVVPVEETPVQ